MSNEREDSLPPSTPSTRSLSVERDGPVMVLTLCRAERYNTITAQLRDELDAALECAQHDAGVKVVLLRAEGPAFCAGYDLQIATAHAADESVATRQWDSVADMHMISSYVRVFQKLWYLSKPTVCAVKGWCLAGGTDLALWSDLILAGRSAVFGYPPSRVWGVPTNPLWVPRVGLQAAKRFLLTGDEIPSEQALGLGLVQQVVADDELDRTALALAHRMGALPLSQLEMLKLFCNHQAEFAGLQTTRLLGILFDGVARHTQEGLDFVTHARANGFRQAVRDRDRPFRDYGSANEERHPCSGAP
jgi:enoyl-CoA hydratase